MIDRARFATGLCALVVATSSACSNGSSAPPPSTTTDSGVTTPPPDTTPIDTGVEDVYVPPLPTCPGVSPRDAGADPGWTCCPLSVTLTCTNEIGGSIPDDAGAPPDADADADASTSCPILQGYGGEFSYCLDAHGCIVAMPHDGCDGGESWSCPPNCCGSSCPPDAGG